ncbi:MAG: type I-B CRISPR-associated protein Cas5, partial [Campylobacterales bacterium]|nr:type I-B CRISPR-associated protein Cas5 [Campylobacterales bacterium]
GGNLIVREQWLENPKWQIMILDDGSEEFAKISEYLLSGKSVFIPYLGKNDHPANIMDVKSIVLSGTEGSFIDSLFVKNFEKLDGWAREGDSNPYFFQEFSPYALQRDYHFYEYKPLVFTNYEIANIPEDTYCYGGKNYSFI